MEKKRVALLFFGLSRSLGRTIASIKEHLLQPLLDNSFEYDIYVHTYKIHGEYHNTWSREHTANYINEDVSGLLNPTYYLEDDQKEIIRSIKFKEYYTRLGRWSGTFRPELVRELIKNMVLALYSKKRITSLFEEHKDNYDYAMIVRPDMYFQTTLNANWFSELTDTTVIVPSKDWYNKGCNDRFCIGKPDVVVYYGKLFDELKEYSTKRSITSEGYLFNKLKEKQITILAKDINYSMLRMQRNVKRSSNSMEQ